MWVRFNTLFSLRVGSTHTHMKMEKCSILAHLCLTCTIHVYGSLTWCWSAVTASHDPACLSPLQVLFSSFSWDTCWLCFLSASSYNSSPPIHQEESPLSRDGCRPTAVLWLSKCCRKGFGGGSNWGGGSTQCCPWATLWYRPIAAFTDANRFLCNFTFFWRD